MAAQERAIPMSAAYPQTQTLQKNQKRRRKAQMKSLFQLHITLPQESQIQHPIPKSLGTTAQRFQSASEEEIFHSRSNPRGQRRGGLLDPWGN